MNIGDTVTWLEVVPRHQKKKGRRIRITTGVIVGRCDELNTRFQIQVLKMSGSLPTKARDIIWCDANALKMGRAEECQHLNTYTPLELEKRQARIRKRRATRARRRTSEPTLRRPADRPEQNDQPSCGNLPEEWAFNGSWHAEMIDAKYGLARAARMPSKSTRKSEWRLGRAIL